jgi:hypothetical protein
LAPFILVLVVVFGIWGGVIYLQYKRSFTEAKAVFNARRNRAEFPADEPFEPFERAFLRTSDVRVSVYRWLASLFASFSVPFFIMLGGIIWARLYYLSGRPTWMTEGELLHLFYLALCSMGGLVLVAMIFTRRYHTRHPADFETEWENEKQANAQRSTSTQIHTA